MPRAWRTTPESLPASRARLPDWLMRDLQRLLAEHTTCPVAVRSPVSSRTLNFNPSPASTTPSCCPTTTPTPPSGWTAWPGGAPGLCLDLFRKRQLLCPNTIHRIEDEKMAVIVQHVIGRRRRLSFFPACPAWCVSVTTTPSALCNRMRASPSLRSVLAKPWWTEGRRCAFRRSTRSSCPSFLAWMTFRGIRRGSTMP